MNNSKHINDYINEYIFDFYDTGYITNFHKILKFITDKIPLQIKKELLLDMNNSTLEKIYTMLNKECDKLESRYKSNGPNQLEKYKKFKKISLNSKNLNKNKLQIIFNILTKLIKNTYDQKYKEHLLEIPLYDLFIDKSNEKVDNPIQYYYKKLTKAFINVTDNRDKMLSKFLINNHIFDNINISYKALTKDIELYSFINSNTETEGEGNEIIVDISYNLNKSYDKLVELYYKYINITFNKLIELHNNNNIQYKNFVDMYNFCFNNINFHQPISNDSVIDFYKTIKFNNMNQKFQLIIKKLNNTDRNIKNIQKLHKLFTANNRNNNTNNSNEAEGEVASKKYTYVDNNLKLYIDELNIDKTNIAFSKEAVNILYKYKNIISEIREFKRNVDEISINEMNASVENLFDENKTVLNLYDDILDSSVLNTDMKIVITKLHNKLYNEHNLKEEIINDDLIEEELINEEELLEEELLEEELLEEELLEEELLNDDSENNLSDDSIEDVVDKKEEIDKSTKNNKFNNIPAESQVVTINKVDRSKAENNLAIVSEFNDPTSIIPPEHKNIAIMIYNSIVNNLNAQILPKVANAINEIKYSVDELNIGEQVDDYSNFIQKKYDSSDTIQFNEFLQLGLNDRQ